MKIPVFPWIKNPSLIYWAHYLAPTPWPPWPASPRDPRGASPPWWARKLHPANQFLPPPARRCFFWLFWHQTWGDIIRYNAISLDIYIYIYIYTYAVYIWYIYIYTVYICNIYIYIHMYIVYTYVYRLASIWFQDLSANGGLGPSILGNFNICTCTFTCVYIYREREYRLGDWPSNLGVPDFETNQLVAMMQGRSEMSHCASS